MKLKTRVLSTSCRNDSESCCGNDHGGHMAVERDGERIVLPVSYYRGG